ncbi:MAG: glycosyltransferase [Myxococcales bacterium]|nr:glycosyltransferase [Myxococcales bacterium]
MESHATGATYALLVVFELLRLALRGLLVVLVVHFARAAWATLRRRPPTQPEPPESWPRVTVQLPLRNEFYVVERVIRAACALDYPADKLDIQVLDDSTDETRELAQGLVEAAREEGVSIEHLHRAQPSGFKAGALNHGLESARGDFLAMFDADCVPPKDFLRRVVPHFADEGVGCVQVRWGFLNRHHSLLTRLQAIVLDGLFVVDQHARASARLPLQFNGTNGVWRRKAIDAAGGWSPEILAEDADLSFRAYLAGYRVLHMSDYTVPTEVPEDMAAFRAQQRRWALGSAQMLRTLSVRILLAGVPWRSKLMMFMHLGRHAIDPLILLACLTSPFTTLWGMPFLVDYGTFWNAGLVGLVLLSSLMFYGTAITRGGSPAREALLVPLILPLAMGMSLLYTVAFFSGIFAQSGEFVRTPKAGNEGTLRKGPRYRAPRDPLVLCELALGAAHTYFAWLALSKGIYAYFLFFGLVAGSFGWVGLATALSRGVGGGSSKSAQ